MSIRFNLTAGKSYVILPAVNQEYDGTDREFFLSIYFNIPVHEVDIRCLTTPETRCKYN